MSILISERFVKRCQIAIRMIWAAVILVVCGDVLITFERPIVIHTRDELDALDGEQLR